MPSNSKSSDSLVVYWLSHVIVFSLVYLLVMHPLQIGETENWIAVGWIFFLASIPSFLIMLLVHFMLLSIDQKYKRYGIRLMSWVAFLITYELWKASEGANEFLDPLFREPFGIAALLLAVSHVLTFMLLERIGKNREEFTADEATS